jgi:hypothetical protein
MPIPILFSSCAKSFCATLLSALLLVSIGTAAETEPTTQAAKLLFSSGFEPGSKIVETEKYYQLDIVGRDKSSPAGPSDWVGDLDEHDQLGAFNIRFDTEAPGGAYARIVDDPTNSGRGKVLEFWLRDPSERQKKGRVQANLYGGQPGNDEITSAVKIRLHPDLGVLSEKPEAIDWFTLQELWASPDWNLIGRNFRITLGIGKREGAGKKLHWLIHADEAGKGGKDFWKHDTADRGILASGILGEWVTLVLHYKKGDATSGRLRVKIVKADGTEQEIFDLTTATMHPTDVAQQNGLTHHNPMKLYTAKTTVDHIREHAPAKAAIIHWDDWHYWAGNAYDLYPAKATTSKNGASFHQPAEAGFRGLNP